LPALSDDVLNWAVPPLKLTVTGAPPSTANCTVPVGVPDPGAVGVTVAVKVTVCPNTEGLADEVTPVVVLALFTTWPPPIEPLLAA
jgi:hypothetical protein